jgi:hypothetical protein
LGEERSRANAAQRELENERRLREVAERQVLQLEAAPARERQQQPPQLTAPPKGSSSGTDGFVPVETVQLMSVAMSANAAAMTANAKALESVFGGPWNE